MLAFIWIFPMSACFNAIYIWCLSSFPVTLVEKGLCDGGVMKCEPKLLLWTSIPPIKAFSKQKFWWIKFKFCQQMKIWFYFVLRMEKGGPQQWWLANAFHGALLSTDGHLCLVCSVKGQMPCLLTSQEGLLIGNWAGWFSVTKYASEASLLWLRLV